MRPARPHLQCRGNARNRRARRCCGWIAAVALLFQALLPAYAAAASVSQFPNSASPPAAANLVAICTGAGVIWVALDDDGQPAAPRPAPAKPCHFCPCHATVLELPKSPPLDAGAPRVAAPLPYSGEIAGRKTVSMLPRAIRAPPVTL